MTRRTTALADNALKHRQKAIKKHVRVQLPQTLAAEPSKTFKKTHRKKTTKDLNKPGMHIRLKNTVLYRPILSHIKNIQHWLMQNIVCVLRGAPVPWYAVIAIVILISSTVFWAYAGALVQSENADQLVNFYMFESWHTFNRAVFPGAHTFFFKWPLLIIAAVFGNTRWIIMVLTVLLSTVTVLALAYLIKRIEKRPQVWTLHFLVLSVLLLHIPPQAHDLALLPTNMAMVMTRNIEYIVYIAAIAYAVRVRTYRSKDFVMATALLTLLFASDRLFVGLSVGAAVAGIFVMSLLRRKAYRRRMAWWLLASISAVIISMLFLEAIRISGLTHISASEESPYTLAVTLPNLRLAIWYGFWGMLTQFGANPMFDATTVALMPQRLMDNLIQPGGIGWLLSISFFIGIVASVVTGLYRFYTAIKASKKVKSHTKKPDLSSHSGALTIGLVFSAAIAVGLFIGTKHYYAADSRYLTIVFFAGILATVTVISRLRVKIKTIRVLSWLALGSLPFAMYNAGHIATAQYNAYNDIAAKNRTIQAYLQENNVHVLVGDYWRVMPIKAGAGKHLTVYPLADCTTPRMVLTSSAWRPDTQDGPLFAYLLTRSSGLAGGKGCNLEQVTKLYGGPSTVRRIAGPAHAPEEQLLLFDGNSAKRKTLASKRSNTSIKNYSEVITSRCIGKTYLNVVAHQDDDLLFMNPDIQDLIIEGNCVRTIYLTAGDSGGTADYGKARLQGAQAAYNTMLGEDSKWRYTSIQMRKGQLAIVAEPTADKRVTLIGLQLPDGELFGRGFQSNGFNSVSHLFDNKSASILTIDGSSVYTKADLTEVLGRFIRTYRPARINTFSIQGGHVADHSDHHVTGLLVNETLSQLQTANFAPPTVRRYYGYPVQTWPQNVFDEALAKKETAFLNYAQYDGATCRTLEDCYSAHSTYGLYLGRQYYN
jgi:LmbE family N-acetylglucosaminyl deacetylase